MSQKVLTEIFENSRNYLNRTFESSDILPQTISIIKKLEELTLTNTFLIYHKGEIVVCHDDRELKKV